MECENRTSKKVEREYTFVGVGVSVRKSAWAFYEREREREWVQSQLSSTIFELKCRSKKFLLCMHFHLAQNRTVKSSSQMGNRL